MDTDFLVDKDELGILSQKRIKREIKAYNRALLFNRKELDSLRKEGIKTIKDFSEGKVKLDGNISGLCTNCITAIDCIIGRVNRIFNIRKSPS